MIAINTIRAEPHYRRAAFDDGLERVGYRIVQSGKPKQKQDLLVLWNVHGPNEQRRREWEAKGGTVLVCENGYLGVDEKGQQLYAIAVHGHNGSGWFPIGNEDRFAALGIEVQEWRESALRPRILICGQRGIGPRDMASPTLWEDKSHARLRAMGHSGMMIRRHPGRRPPATTIEQDLHQADVCAIWSSSCGVRALIAGVPVVYSAPHWVCESAAGQSIGMVNELVRDDARREAALQRMAHAQWRVSEIEAGEPFARILAQLESATWR